MGFWRTELERFKTHIASRPVDAFFIMSNENSREMKVVYTRLGNITSFMEWLEMMADQETLGEGASSILLSVGGGD